MSHGASSRVAFVGLVLERRNRGDPASVGSDARGRALHMGGVSHHPARAHARTGRCRAWSTSGPRPRRAVEAPTGCPFRWETGGKERARSGPRLPPGPDRAAPGARPPARSPPDHALQEASAPADRDSGGRSGGAGAREVAAPAGRRRSNRRRRSIVVQAEEPASVAADYARYLCPRVVQLGLRRPTVAGLHARSQECVAAVGLEAPEPRRRPTVSPSPPEWSAD